MSESRHSVSPAIQVGKQGLYLNVHAQPGAKRPQLRGMHGNAVKIAVAEAAQDGKANAAIVDLLARALKVSRSQIEVASGHTSRSKRVFLSGDVAVLRKKLEFWLDG